MQEALPVTVPSMGGAKRTAMPETDPEADIDARKPAVTGPAGTRLAGSAAAEAAAADTDENADADEKLMAAFKRGHGDAFTALFLRYKQPLFGFFRRRVADAAQAEELTQETFLAVLRAAPRYEASALFRTWLYAIAFKILSAHRRKAAFRAVFHGEQPVGLEPAVENALDAQVLIREAVGKLDAMGREVLLLREFEQLSYAEIATVLHLPVNTVRSRLFRARTALHDLLAAPAPETTISDFREERA
jgi:RNA polymerase sigma-70 factor (ECF subfamily)